MLNITLNQIRRKGPCTYGWDTLLKFLKKAEADDEPLSFLTIMESNGIEDALWALDCLPKEFSGKVRLLACIYADKGLHHIPEGEEAPRLAVEAARKFAKGEITYKEMEEAKEFVRWLIPKLKKAGIVQEPISATWAAFSTCYMDGAAMAAMSWVTDFDMVPESERTEIFVNWLKEFDQ